MAALSAGFCRRIRRYQTFTPCLRSPQPPLKDDPLPHLSPQRRNARACSEILSHRLIERSKVGHIGKEACGPFDSLKMGPASSRTAARLAITCSTPQRSHLDVLPVHGSRESGRYRGLVKTIAGNTVDAAGLVCGHFLNMFFSSFTHRCVLLLCSSICFAIERSDFSMLPLDILTLRSAGKRLPGANPTHAGCFPAFSVQASDTLFHLAAALNVVAPNGQPCAAVAPDAVGGVYRQSLLCVFAEASDRQAITHGASRNDTRDDK